MKNIKQAEFGRREIEIAEQGKSGAWGLWGLQPGALLSGDQELSRDNFTTHPAASDTLSFPPPSNHQIMWGRARHNSKR